MLHVIHSFVEYCPSLFDFTTNFLTLFSLVFFHREKEEMRLKLLEEEYQKRDRHRELLVKQKVLNVKEYRTVHVHVHVGTV